MIAQGVFKYIQKAETGSISAFIESIRLKPWIAVLVVMLALTVVVPLYLYRLDRNQFKFAEMLE
jgi:hypothetical protein